MRTSLALVALLLAVGQIQASNSHHGFEEGKTYVYHYSGRIATGISEEVKQFSGTAMRGKLHVQQDGGKLAFQLHDSELGLFNKKIENVLEALQTEYGRPDMSQHNLHQMEKPFWVEYNEGVFENIYFAENEDIDKHNIKKAIGTIFQLYLPIEGDLHFYHRDEDSVTGTCPTYYNVGHYHETDHQILNVTKFRDYTSCEHRPHLFYSSIKGHKCSECDEQYFKPLRSSSTVKYSLKGNREKYVIEKIHSTGVLAISPFDTNGQSVISVVNQTLVLEKVEDATPVEHPAIVEKHHSLHYKFHNDERDYKNVDLKVAHYYDRVYSVDRTGRVEKANDLYEELGKELSTHQAEISRYIPKFIDILVTFDYDDFENFYGKTVLPCQQHNLKYSLLEILPFLGTNPSILYVMKIIRNKEVEINVAKKLIMKLPFYVKEPSKALIDAARSELSTSSIVKENTVIHTMSVLAYGTLLNQACVENVFHPHPADKTHYVDEEDCKTYIQELIAQFNASENDEHRTLYLRALINADTKDAFNFIVSVVKSENPKYDQLVRQVAMLGMFFVSTDEQKKQVYEAVVPIYFDPEEDYVLRIYAMEVLLYLTPTPELYGSLILTLNSPQTPQKLKSYIYASVSAIANTTDPCFAAWKKYSRNAVQYVEHYQRDVITDSIVRIFSFYNAKYNYGRSSVFATVASDDSIFPRELYLAQSFNIFGYRFDTFQMGYSSKGQSFHEDYLSELGIAPRGLAPKISEITNNLVKKTIEKFGFKHGYEHQMKPYEFFISMFNKDIYATRTLIQDFAQRDQTFQIHSDGEKIFLNINKLGYVSVEALIPNEAGLPVSFKVRVPLAAHIHGSLKFEEKVNEVDGQFKTTGYHVEPDLHLGVDSRVYSHVVVLAPLLGKAGYALKTKAGIRFPLKGNFDYDLTEKQFQVKHIPTTDAYDVLFYKTTPYTVLGEDKQMIHYSEHPTNKKYIVGYNYFGAGLTFNFTYDYYWNDYASYKDFLKSFFKQSKSYETYQYLSDKWYAGSRNFFSYIGFNPTAKPFSFNARFSPCHTNPTTEFVYTSQKKLHKHYDTDINKGYTGLFYKGELVAKGGAERKWEVEFDVKLQYPFTTSRTIKFHFKRTALPGYDREPFEMCFNGGANITDFAAIFALQPVEVKVNHESQVRLGRTCDADSSKIDIKMMVEKSDEQLSLDKTTLPDYVKCIELSQKGYNFNEHCWKSMLDLGRLDKLTVGIDHHNLPNYAMDVILHFWSWFRHYFRDNLHIDYFHGSNKPNHWNFVANVSYHHPTVMDITFVRTDKTCYYNNIYAPNLLPQFEPLNVIERPQDRIARKIFNYHMPMCLVTGKYVRTFDNVVFKAPLGETWHLAFSDTYWNRVYIYFKAVTGSKYTNAAMIYLDDSVITLTPRGDDITVDIEGPVLEEKDAYIKEGRYILYRFGPAYALESDYYRIHFYYDGINGVIGASNFYRGKQHGICGNFDGETQNEFEGPDGTHYEDPSSYVHSYSVE